ncbi:MAG: Glutamate--tRNA ligase [Alphaproteobacteria bacterium ADurb.Bin438]|nr:MAG: Glutamate--tRNA ligase [Alphaproteobacteria bacterium ADurb.Bin438]
MKEEQRRLNKPIRYNEKWRDKCEADAPSGIKPTIRLKTPNEGETILKDLIQGEIRIANDQIDDMVLIRSDGTPTYMLSVVVDDHDMGVNTVIRTSDHLTNAFRQMMIINALNWDIPTYAHMPLILSKEGEKLSKDNGLMTISETRELGYLPEALLSYLLGLGWHHESEDIVDIYEAFKSFDVKDMVKSPAKFDIAKLNHINGYFIRKADDKRLAELIKPLIFNSLGFFEEEKQELLIKSMHLLKKRSKNLIELAVMAEFIVEERPIMISNASRKIISQGQDILRLVIKAIEPIQNFDYDNIKEAIQELISKQGLQIEQIAPLIRATVSGSESSPPIFSVMEIMGKDEIIKRIEDQIC